MPVIRNQVATTVAGGRRQFAELRDTFLVESSDGSQQSVSRELEDIQLNTIKLTTANVTVARPNERFDTFLDSLRDQIDGVDTAIDDIQEDLEESDGVVDATESVASVTQGILDEILNLEGVVNANFGTALADYGPENLRMSPFDMETISEVDDKNPNLNDILQELDYEDAWSATRGENATVAIFDTGYAEDLIDSGRIVGTFHAEEVDSVFESSEGHGTMCAGAAAANSDEGVPMDGAAPGSDVILVRTTGEGGQIRTDVIARAWDWLTNQTDGTPIVANHSYGTPICSSINRGQSCNDALAKVIEEASSSPDITPVYAAGNEAMYCGHRLSGVTNGITGHNSLESVICCGALLSNGRDAQRYSSHGRGDCSPRADPKPNASFRLPKFTYYGGEDGYLVKDMSTGIFGSGGGTSHAAPTLAGSLALLQSRAVDQRGEAFQTEEIKNIIKRNSDPPRRNQVNSFGFFAGPKGYDARFGFGQFKVNKAISEIS